MYALQECIKIQACAAADYNFAVQHELALRQGEQGGNYLRKIPAQRLTGLGLENHFIALAKRQAAEAIPLWLIKPAGFVRQGIYRLSFRRRIRRLDGQTEFGKSLGKLLSGNSGRSNVGRFTFTWRDHASWMRSDDIGAVPIKPAVASESRVPRS